MKKQYSEGRIEAKRIQASINSWLAHASHADSLGLRKSILNKAVFVRQGTRTQPLLFYYPK